MPAMQETERDQEGSLDAVIKDMQGLRNELETLHNNVTTLKAATQVCYEPACCWAPQLSALTP